MPKKRVKPTCSKLAISKFSKGNAQKQFLQLCIWAPPILTYSLPRTAEKYAIEQGLFATQNCHYASRVFFIPIQVPPLQQETAEAKVEDIPGEPTTQEEPMETEEPQEDRPVPAPEQEKQPASPKPTTSLPPPPPLTPTIVVSEVKPTPPGVRSPKSPLSPSTSHSRVTRTRSSRKDADATDVTEQQQLQQQVGH